MEMEYVMESDLRVWAEIWLEKSRIERVSAIEQLTTISLKE